MIKALLYDLGDIFFEAHYWRKWMYDTLSEMGCFSGSFAEFYILYDNSLADVYAGNASYKANYANFIRSLNVPHVSEFIEKSFEKKLHFEKNRTLYPQVESTLRAVWEKGIMNIVLTDNESDERQLRKTQLQPFGIDRYINKVFTSKESGVTKPHPHLFELALQYAGADKNEVLFVAHDKDEIDGAEEYGIRTVEFNNYLELPTRASFKMNRFGELTTIVREVQ